jgi:hypothetical protein
MAFAKTIQNPLPFSAQSVAEMHCGSSVGAGGKQSFVRAIKTKIVSDNKSVSKFRDCVQTFTFSSNDLNVLFRGLLTQSRDHWPSSGREEESRRISDSITEKTMDFMPHSDVRLLTRVDAGLFTSGLSALADRLSELQLAIEWHCQDVAQKWRTRGVDARPNNHSKK